MLEAIQTSRRCAFCERPEWNVKFLIAGPKSFICNDCVKNAGTLLAELQASDEAEAVTPLYSEAPDKYIHQLLSKHFQPMSTNDIVTSSRIFPARMRADLQRSLDTNLSAALFTGFFVRHSYQTTTIAVLLSDERDAITVSPPRFEEVDVGEDEPVRCLQQGLWLLQVDDVKMAVLLSPEGRHGEQSGSYVEIAVPAGMAGQEAASRLFKKLEQALQEARSYRGKVLSLEMSDMYSGQSVGVRVHRLEPVRREDLVLPAKTVDLLTRNVIEFSRQREQLKKYGKSLKKGLLFYGPPGTGKSFTLRYLATQLPGHTTLLVTAEQIGLIREYITLARLLQPAMVVIEDADLIARERGMMGSACEETMLNRLLNEMDGLAEDAEILFVLSTNRPEAIEPAVAGRPGRIDQAIEFPLPDKEGRLKLARLYCGNTPVEDNVLEAVAHKTHNVSAAFIKELMRRATQFYLEQGGEVPMTVAEVDAALEEMLISGGKLNVKLLGGDVGAIRE